MHHPLLSDFVLFNFVSICASINTTPPDISANKSTENENGGKWRCGNAGDSETSRTKSGNGGKSVSISHKLLLLYLISPGYFVIS